MIKFFSLVLSVVLVLVIFLGIPRKQNVTDELQERSPVDVPRDKSRAILVDIIAAIATAIGAII